MCGASSGSCTGDVLGSAQGSGMGTDYDELVRRLELAAIADRDPTRRRKAQGMLVVVTAVEGTRRVLDHLISPTTGDGGLFDALAPARVAEAMLYPQRYLSDVDPDGLEVFPVLATELAAYFRERRSGKVLPVPSEAELEEHFSVFAPVIAAAWPVASIVAEVVTLRCSQPTDLAHREAVLMHSARASCLLRDPPEVGREHYDALLAKILGREAATFDIQPESVMAEVAQALEERARTGMLAYDPTRGAQFFGYWRTIARNASIDALDRRARQLDPTRPARSTLEKYGVGLEEGRARKREGERRRAHRDPAGLVKTVGEIAERHERPESAVRLALKRVEAQRGRKAPRGRTNAYALDRDWEDAVVAELGAERQGKLTLSQAAKALKASEDALFKQFELWATSRGGAGAYELPERHDIRIPKAALKALRVLLSKGG